MKISNSFKAGLYFGIIMSVLYMAVSLAIELLFRGEHIAGSIYFGLAAGAVAGLLFGGSIALFRRSKWLEKSTRITTHPGETVLFVTGANHFIGRVAVGGRLYYTNKRIVFKSHAFNIHKHELSIALENIQGAERYKTLGLVNNGLSIITSADVKEKFVVEQVEEWVNLLSLQVTH